MNLSGGVGSLSGGGGVVLGIVGVVIYLLVLAVSIWIGYVIMRHAVMKGVLRALEKAGITTHGHVGTFTVTSETTGTTYAPRPTGQAPPQ